jgi:small conductance mechanosensitive channel
VSVLARASSDSTGYVYDLVRRLGGSDFFARTAQFVLVRPLRIALIVAVAWLVARVGSRACLRSVHSLRLRAPGLLVSERAESRAATVGGALGSVFRAIVWIVAVLTILGELGIKLAPFIAGATVVGAALGFGAQSLVRDFLSGLLILLEDQYGVGDTIVVGDTRGTVESLNLRTTRFRAQDGIVWYVPNGEIRKVGNSSEDFGRAVVDLVVPPDADLQAAIAAVSEEVSSLVADPAWADSVLEAPEVVGVEQADSAGVTIRVMVKTVVGQSAALARALRLRTQERLRRDGMGWPGASPG